MRGVTINGESMYFVPKFYVKNTSYNGMPAFFVCGYPKSGYHIHPAFVNNGIVTEHGVLIGIPTAKGSYKNLVSTPSGIEYTFYNPTYARESVDARNTDPSDADCSGWHLYNIYEHSMLQRLSFMKYAGTSDATYIRMPSFGSGSKLIFIDGISLTPDADNNCYRCSILNNTQTGYVDIPVSLPGAGQYFNRMADAVGDNYDLGDVFLPKSFLSDQTGIYGSYGAYITTETPLNYSSYALGVHSSMFNLYITKTLSSTSFYCRLAKFC